MQPAKIGKMELRNRIVMAPMGTTIGNMTESTVSYFVERAKGGAGMIFCNIMGSRSFEPTEHSIVFSEETEKLFRKVVDQAHSFGCKVGAQIMPGNGRIGGPSIKYPVPISASSCPWKFAPEVPCHALTVEEIHQLEEDYRKSAEAAVRCGADCIEIHAYGGYLADQFFTTAWNSRTDEYGGSLENRARFVKELIQICKEVGGADFPVLVKFTPDHYMDGEGYRKIDEGVELAKLLVQYGADALHVDAGCHENWYYAMPPAGLQGMTLQSRSAKIIKQMVDVPVMTHGRFGDVDKAESAIRNGVCDLAVIGRGLLADPELPNKIAARRPDEIRPCISCNEFCIGRVYSGKPACCAMNPRCGYEDGSRDIPKTKHPKKILIVGGGPAGCAAALYARQAGHKVEIWEKGSCIGGNVLNAVRPFFKRDMDRLVKYFIMQLIKWEVPIRFYKEATPEAAAKFAPDHIIWATGGKSIVPTSIPGLDSPNVYLAADALRDCCDVGDHVLVVGGGLVGVETALQLDNLGKQVTCIEMADTIPSEPGFIMNDELMKVYMDRSNVQFMPGTKLLSVEGDAFGCKATVETGGKKRVIECQTLLMALGFAPTSGMAEEYRDIAPVTCVGDSVEPRKIAYAIEDAYEAVRSL